MVDTAQLVARVETKGVKTATDQLDKFSKTSTRAETSSIALGKTSSKLTKSFQVQKGAARQLGFQIQDIAVQLDGGARASTVFAQQGSQIASIFGPAGAIVGAIIATSAAIAGPFVASLLGGASAADTLEESLESLGEVAKRTDEGILGLTNRINALSSASLEERILKAKDALAAAREEAIDFGGTLDFEEFGGRFSALSLSFRQLRTQFEEGQIPLQQYRAEIDKLFLSVDDPSKELRTFRDSLDEVADKSKFAFETLTELRNTQDGLAAVTIDNIKATDKLTNSYDRFFNKISMLGATSLELIDMQQAARLEKLEEFRDKDIASDEEYQDLKSRILLDATNKRNKIIDTELAKQQKAIDRQRSIQDKFADAELESQQNFEDNQARIKQKGFDTIQTLTSSNNKEMFRIGKAAAIAQASINIAQGISEALKLTPPLSFVLAAGVAAAGGVQLAAIQSQQPPSARQQGGQFAGGQDLLVGEKGPELVRFNSGGRISNTQETQGLLNGGMAPNVIINNNAAGTVATAETLSTGDVVVIVEQVLNREVNQPNSNFNKSLDRTRNAPRTRNVG